MSGLRLSDWTLRTKLGALITLASALPLITAAYFDVREAREQLIEKMSHVLQARGDQVADEVDALNERYLRSVAKFARLPEIVAYGAWPRPATDAEVSARAALIAQPAEDSQVAAAAIASLKGVVLTATLDELVGKDLSHRSFVREALRGKPTTSEVYVEGAAGREWSTIAFAHPIRDTGSATLGALILWVRAEALWDIAKSANALAGDGSFAIVLDAQGIRIAHSYRDDLVFRPGSELDSAQVEALLAERRFGSRTHELVREVHELPAHVAMARAARPSEEAFLAYAPGNAKLNYGIARRLETLPWTVFYMVPQDTLDAEIAGMMQKRIAFGGALTLAALLIGLAFARLILRPIRSLVEGTERLSSGELSARVPVEPARDELGHLVERFNAMAERIETQAAALLKARDQLERRVQERTSELTETARLLEGEVHERRRAEAELTRSQARFAALSEAGVIGLFTLDLEGRLLDVNDAALAIIGYSREEAMGSELSWLQLTPPEWKAQDDLARVQLSSERVVRPHEKEYFHKDGHRVPVLTGATLLTGSGELVAFVIDLSERRRGEAALTQLRMAEESEAKFRGLLESAPDAVVIIGATGEIAIVNAQTERLFGYTREELIGRPVELLLPQRLAKEHAMHRERYFKQPKARAMGAGLELLGMRRDGTEFPIEISLSPMQTHEGMLVSAAIRDITDRKRAADALAQAKEDAEAVNRELETFSYSVAHDLRAPLRGMKGFATLLHDAYRDKLDADGEDWLNEIELNAERMGTLIDALLSLARLTRNELRPQTVDLSALARELAAQVAAGEPEREVDWAIEDGVLAHVDPVLGRALLQNLLANAWKFTGERSGARIELGTLQHQGERAYYVRDNGAGFEAAYANKLFAPFQRLHTQDEFPGTGIGLATVQRIVHRHGGRVWAEGAVGRGATFYFTLSNRSESP